MIRIDLERWETLRKDIENLIPSGIELTSKDINELGIYAQTFKEEGLQPTRIEKFMVKLDNGYSVESKRYFYTKQSLLNALQKKVNKAISAYKRDLESLIAKKNELEKDIEHMQEFLKEF